MNYFQLALALFTGAYAIFNLGSIVRVACTKASYVSYWDLPLDALLFALSGTISAWNFSLAVAA